MVALGGSTLAPIAFQLPDELIDAAETDLDGPGMTGRVGLKAPETLVVVVGWERAAVAPSFLERIPRSVELAGPDREAGRVGDVRDAGREGISFSVGCCLLDVATTASGAVSIKPTGTSVIAEVAASVTHGWLASTTVEVAILLSEPKLFEVGIRAGAGTAAAEGTVATVTALPGARRGPVGPGRNACLDGSG